jgi:hypothetical protein
VGDLFALEQRLRQAGVEANWDKELPGFDRFYASDPSVTSGVPCP